MTTARATTNVAAEPSSRHERRAHPLASDEQGAGHRDDGDDQDQHEGALDQDQRLLGALHGFALGRQRIAAVHDDLAEVSGELAPEPVGQLGDLLGRITLAVELGDRGVVEQAELLELLQAVGDQRQKVDGDLTVGDGHAVDQSVAFHHVEECAVASLEHVDQKVAAVRVGETVGQPTLEQLRRAADDRRRDGVAAPEAGWR